MLNKSMTRYLMLTVYCLLLTVLMPAIAYSQIAGKITLVEGRVDILKTGTTASVPANIGDTVSVGDILRTKSDGKAEITFIDNSVMSVGPKSRLGIDEYLYRPDDEKREASLKLYRGRTGFKVPKPVYSSEGSKFEMKTRTAVAGVRGTEGILYTDGVERVFVKEGVIEFSNPLGAVSVSRGEVGEVFYNMAPAERPFTEREYQQHEKQVQPKTPEKAAPQPQEQEAPPPGGKQPPPPEGEQPPPPEGKLPPPMQEGEQPPPPEGEQPPPLEGKLAPPPMQEGKQPPPVEGKLPPPPAGVERPPPSGGDLALLPPPPGGELLPPPPAGGEQPQPPTGKFEGGETAFLPPPITDITLNKSFNITAKILDGDISWRSADSKNTAAAIKSSGSGDISGSFYQTILEGGYYNLSIKGAYSLDSTTYPTSTARDSQFHLFYSGATSEGKSFYGGTAGGIDAAVKSWHGGNAGWIEDGSKKFWFVGNLEGSYNNVIYDNSVSPINKEGAFSAGVKGFFWDGSRPFWEAFQKIVPTLPARPEFFIPITDVALRTFDMSGSGTLGLYNQSRVSAGSMSTTISGKGIEVSPGSGLFDVNVAGNWSVNSGTIQDLSDIKGTINGSTSINTTFDMKVGGGINAVNSNTAIVGADIEKAGSKETSGIMVGKMTGTTSGTFEGKALGEIKSGFVLP